MAKVIKNNIPAKIIETPLILNIDQGTTHNIVYKAMKINVPDNTEFIHKIDKDALGKVAKRKTKTLIVGQDPDAGEFIPAGTPVNLTFIEKDSIPIGSMKVDNTIIGKYANVGKFMDDLNKSDDAIAEVTKNAVESNKGYKNLSANEKAGVDKYMLEHLGEAATANEEKKEAVYKDMKFIATL